MQKPWRSQRKLLRAIAAIAFVGSFWTALERRSGAHAAENSFEAATSTWISPVAMPSHVQLQRANAAATPASATLFRQYCVGCHNARMKASFGNLSLEEIDPSDVSGHAETLEKVVR